MSIEKNPEFKKEKVKLPIDIPGGYYARDYREYKFDKMLRNHAKENGKEAMYEFIRDQDIRNQLRRIDEKLTLLLEGNSKSETSETKYYSDGVIYFEDDGDETQAD